MAKVRTNKNVCLNCFGTLDDNRVCLSCHKRADDSPSLPHHLPQRTVLKDKYLVYKALGEGGFGITYLAWDISCGLKVAIKEYYPSGYVNRMPRSNQVIINSRENQAASNRGLKRFIEEAKTLAKIKNLPGIVSVRDFFSANSTAYIVMEYLDGISLKKYIQRKGGRLTCDEILAILRPVMESLVQVHKLGLIHRDISPDNIIITKNSEVKLIDFGAAKQSNLNGQSLSIVLKQGFAPEEQYRTHGEQGPWTDVYALGVTIYYAITGTLPPESIQRLYKDTIQRPSEKGAIITPTQESALMKALAVYAKHRYSDVTQLITGLYGSRRSPSAPDRGISKETVKRVETPVAPTPTPSRLQTPGLNQRAAVQSQPQQQPQRQSVTQRSYESGRQTASGRTTAAQASNLNTSTERRQSYASAQRAAYTPQQKQEQPKPAETAPTQPAEQTPNTSQRTITRTYDRKTTLMQRLFGKKKK